MTASIPRTIAVPALLAGALAAAACTERGASPVGSDILPGGILEGGLESVEVVGFDRALDYEIFPAERALSDRLVTAHDWPVAPGFESRALVRFDLSPVDTLEAGTEVLSATVRLSYTPPEAPVEVALHRVTSAWEGRAASWTRRAFGEGWATPGGDFDPAAAARFTIPPDTVDTDSLKVEVPADLAEGWLERTTPNHGLIVVQETPGRRVEFDSQSASDTPDRGPGLLLTVRRPGEEPEDLTMLLPEEDTFIVEDENPLSGEGGLLVSGAEPPHRVFLRTPLEEIPEGATVARARLELTIDAARVPGDTLRLVWLQAASDFRGEKTIFEPASPTALADAVAIPPDVQAGDRIVFQSTRLTAVVRRWLQSPEENRGIGLRLIRESTAFGGVRFFGPDAPPVARPKITVLFLPPQSDVGR